MVSVSLCGIAISFAFFGFKSSVAILGEYMPLYMKQKGFSALFIGLVPIFGLLTQTIGGPLFGFLADKFRARKLFMLLSLLLMCPCTLLFMVPRAPEMACETVTRNSSNGRNETTTQTTTNDNANEEGKLRLQFFLLLVLVRGVYELLQRLVLTFITVATVTHTKNDTTKFGYYVFFGEVGSGIALVIVGILASEIRHLHCGYLVPSYFVVFLCTAACTALITLSLPWLKFEYLESRVVSYAEVKSVLLNPHYVLMLIICVHGGICTSFQMRWEFWYMEELGGSPLTMAIGGMVRRPVSGLWCLLSRSIIKRLGELYVIAISLFIFATTFAALAFVTNPWCVIVFDCFQSAAHALIFASFVVHFSKAGSKASSAIIQALVSLMFYGYGKDVGTTITGWLFTTKGTTVTLCGYSVVTALFLTIWMVYISTAGHLDGYMQIPSEDETKSEKLQSILADK